MGKFLFKGVNSGKSFAIRITGTLTLLDSNDDISEMEHVSDSIYMQINTTEIPLVDEDIDYLIQGLLIMEDVIKKHFQSDVKFSLDQILFHLADHQPDLLKYAIIGCVCDDLSLQCVQPKMRYDHTLKRFVEIEQ